MAVASAGPYASLHLTPDRQPHQHPATQFLQARCPSCHPTNSIKALKVVYPISRTRFCYFAKSDGLVNKAGSFDVTANNNTSKSHDNVYGAIIMTKVIGRVHPVHLMNVD